ncbi:MAG: hypothetical protein WCY76_05305, partial [Leucobacter sp.]
MLAAYRAEFVLQPFRFGEVAASTAAVAPSGTTRAATTDRRGTGIARCAVAPVIATVITAIGALTASVPAVVTTIGAFATIVSAVVTTPAVIGTTVTTVITLLGLVSPAISAIVTTSGIISPTVSAIIALLTTVRVF